MRVSCKTLTIILFALLACATCFGQSSFMGLTPGKSTKADVERMLGQPINKISDTFLEYAPHMVKTWPSLPPMNSGKIYVQYRKESSVIERIELLCAEDCPQIMRSKENWEDLSRGNPIPEAEIFKDRGSDNEKRLVFFGAPLFLVLTHGKLEDHAGHFPVEKLGLYSLELFASIMPKGCNASFFGEWETNLGRMTMRRSKGFHDKSSERFYSVNGTYSKNKGTFIGYVSGFMAHDLLVDWKDQTGSGRMRLELHPEMAFDTRGAHTSDRPATITGKWHREKGKGPSEGEVTGRCLQ